MKKIIDGIKNNWLFILFLIPFVFICIENKTPDNDIWFILNNGRYVFNHGIPTIDPFTIHEGLDYVMQQWGTAVMFWGLFHYFGKRALLVFIYLISFALMFIFYKLCYVVSEKKSLSIIITTLVFVFVRNYIVLRPQVISYLLLLIEILCLELYVKKGNYKYLIALPVCSLLLINFQAAMWYFQFVFLLPFIINSLCIERIKTLKKLKIDNYKLKPILFFMIFMIAVGFINPYGIDAITFIFKSYGIESINTVIGEMKCLDFTTIQSKFVLGVIISTFILFFMKKELNFDIRHLCFLCGGTILVFMHNKCYPWFMFLAFYALAYYLKKDKFKIDLKFLQNKYFKALGNGLILGAVIMSICTLGYTIFYSYKSFSFIQGTTTGYSYKEVTDYIVKNYDLDNVILYVDFNNGGYTEYRGLKSYIDGRAELFFKKFNNKSNIFDEYIDVQKKEYYDFKKFVQKYNFTHLIVLSDSYLERYLDKSDDYELSFEDDEYIDDQGEAALKVYVRKDVEVLE